ncbi:hypothetical protein BDZ97DRAFT_1763335 [Flammula alnicola]|nr:hypothetical protein BDZ97DRAFT_1763335 [Flammula alnicola]
MTLDTNDITEQHIFIQLSLPDALLIIGSRYVDEIALFGAKSTFNIQFSSTPQNLRKRVFSPTAWEATNERGTFGQSDLAEKLYWPLKRRHRNRWYRKKTHTGSKSLIEVDLGHRGAMSRSPPGTLGQLKIFTRSFHWVTMPGTGRKTEERGEVSVQTSDPDGYF